MITQILAVSIFIVMFVMIVMEKIPRHLITLGAGLLMIVLVFGVCMRSPQAIIDTLAFKNIFHPSFWYAAHEATEESSGINWATILFIGGMMVMIEGMGHAGFFKWLCLTLAKAVKYDPVKILIAFMTLSAALAMFIDSITVILFLARATIELARLLRFDPGPMIIAEVFCANLGGSATMCGDPPNIIIGTSLHYSFGDFITNTGPIAAVGLIFTLVYFYIVMHKKVRSEVKDPSLLEYPEPNEVIQSKRDFFASVIIFAIAVVLLVTHAQTGLTVATIGIGVAIVTAIVYAKALKDIMAGVDYKTLLFFVGLFIVVGGLEQTGILELIANFIAKVSGGNLLITIAIILWVSAIASAFVDNIPFAATMVPIIKDLAMVEGFDLSTLAWTLSMGTDIGGSATPIGASANVVGCSVSSENDRPIGWGEYCKYSAPATIIVIAISMIMLFVRYGH